MEKVNQEKAKEMFNDLYEQLTGIKGCEVEGLVLSNLNSSFAGKLEIITFSDEMARIVKTGLLKEEKNTKKILKKYAVPDTDETEIVLKEALDFYNKTNWSKSEVYRHLAIEHRLGYSLRQFSRKLNDLIKSNP